MPKKTINISSTDLDFIWGNLRLLNNLPTLPNAPNPDPRFTSKSPSGIRDVQGVRNNLFLNAGGTAFLSNVNTFLNPTDSMSGWGSANGLFTRVTNNGPTNGFVSGSNTTSKSPLNAVRPDFDKGQIILP